MRFTEKLLYRKLKAMGVCPDALRLMRENRPRDFASMWAACPYGGWIDWMVFKVCDIVSDEDFRYKYDIESPGSWLSNSYADTLRKWFDAEGLELVLPSLAEIQRYVAKCRALEE